jgi:hypothetical protein
VHAYSLYLSAFFVFLLKLSCTECLCYCMLTVAVSLFKLSHCAPPPLFLLLIHSPRSYSLPHAVASPLLSFLIAFFRYRVHFDVCFCAPFVLFHFSQIIFALVCILDAPVFPWITFINSQSFLTPAPHFHLH